MESFIFQCKSKIMCGELHIVCLGTLTKICKIHEENIEEDLKYKNALRSVSLLTNAPKQPSYTYLPPGVVYLRV